MRSRSRGPISSYRLQFQPDFTFRDAAAVVPYLAALGVTECYTSPYLKARPGSRHGYDICDYNALNPDLGDEDDYVAFTDALAAHGMGHIFDLVPNHMSVDPSSNLWWRDVLTHGQASAFAHYFDIDWAPPKAELIGKILLPILSCQYGEALEKGDLAFAITDGTPAVCYGNIQLPIDPATLPDAANAPAGLVSMLNGQPGVASSYDALHRLLEAQHYRLAYWRTSAHEINYRRFFDIDELVGVRMEEPDVFEAAHRLVARLIAEGRVTGLRIDHLDGLAAPAEYRERLRQISSEPPFVVVEKILAPDQTLPADWPIDGTTGYRFLTAVNGLFVRSPHWRLVQRAYTRFTGLNQAFDDVAYLSKKLVMETTLSSELNALAQMLNRLSERDRRSRDFTLNSLRRALREFIASLSVYRTYLPDETDRADERRIRDAVFRARLRNPELESSIFQFVSNVILESARADQAERRRFVTRLQQYTGSVQARGLEDTAFYRHNVLVSVNEVGGDPARPSRSSSEFHRANQERLERWRFEMLATATHDTKLGEDVRARINVLSELPERWRAVVRRSARINASHRTRLDNTWAPDRNDEYRFYQVLAGIWPAVAPDRRAAAAGLVDRLDAYMLKAVREAKLHTSWINDNEPYEAAVSRFVRRALAGPTTAAFLEAFLPLVSEIATAGAVNGLSQLVLKIASPGVPDFYQGTELWDLHLVDPDNRHPVDFDARRTVLTALDPLIEASAGRRAPADPIAVRRLAEAWPDGRIKLFITAAGLRLRREWPEIFLSGRYVPLEAEAEPPAEIIAFAREHDDLGAIVVAPRFVSGLIAETGGLPLGPAWRGARVLLRLERQPHQLRNVLTGEIVRPEVVDGRWSLRIGDLLANCPVALLAF